MELIDGMAVFGDPIEESALNQLRTTKAHPAVRATALMADHHKGYAVPIGGVVAYENAISPAGVGYDIACGNCAVRNWSGRRSCDNSGLRSESVSTACTPGRRCAAALSIVLMAAWACGLRTKAPSNVPAKCRSATKRPAPVSSGRSSVRLTGWPI